MFKEIVVDTREAEKVIQKFKANIEELKTSPKPAEFVAQVLRRNTPVKTGRLKRSITTKTGAVYMLPYWQYTEYGVKPHKILPKKAKALKFQVDKKAVFAKKVEHPGFKGIKWFSQSLKEAKTRLRETVKQLIVKRF